MSLVHSEAFAEWVAREVAALGGDGSRAIAIEAIEPPMERNERRKALVCGVYFLMDGNEIVYVGQSINVYSRIGKHVTDRLFQFDSFSVTECPATSLNELEAKQIHDIQPRWNKVFPAHLIEPYMVRNAAPRVMKKKDPGHYSQFVDMGETEK